MTELARRLKRGDTQDPEDHRMTRQLMVARGILGQQGAIPVVRHHGTVWPEWVTDDVFLAVAQAANVLQTRRDEYEQKKAAREKAQRDAALLADPENHINQSWTT